MKRFQLAARLIFLSLISLGPAKTIWSAEPPSTQYRYLFVVETSEVTQPHINEAAQFIAEMIRNEFETWIRNGEAIGVWNFNEQVLRDTLSTERWSPEQKERIADHVEQFLPRISFGGTSDLSGAWQAVQSIAGASDESTVFIIHARQQHLTGTPFDRPITDAYDNLRQDNSGAAPLLVTRFDVRRGQFTGWAMEALGRGDTAQPPAIDQENTSAVDTVTNALVDRKQAETELRSAEPRDQNLLSSQDSSPADSATNPLPPPPELPPELTVPLNVLPLSYDDTEEGATAVFPRDSFIVIPPASPENSSARIPEPEGPEQTSPEQTDETKATASGAESAETPVLSDTPNKHASSARAVADADTSSAKDPTTTPVNQKTSPIESVRAIEESGSERKMPAPTASSVAGTPPLDMKAVLPNLDKPHHVATVGEPALRQSLEAEQSATDENELSRGVEDRSGVASNPAPPTQTATTDRTELQAKAAAGSLKGKLNPLVYLGSGVSLLAVSGLLIVLVIRRRRGPRPPSLISCSIDQQNSH